MSEKLKPCPFCGGEAAYRETVNGVCWVTCLSCIATTNAETNKEKAIAEWNRRASGWIKTSERLPEMCKNVLVFSDEGEIYIGFMQLYSEWKINEYSSQTWGISYRPEEFPFWMPLPEPPEVEE